MWERFRTGTGGAPGHDSSTWNPSSRRQQQQQQYQGQQGLGQQLPPSSTNINNNPNYSSSNNANSWQPRSSVIAQRQRQQQPGNHRHNNHHNQQQLRSASVDNYPGSGSAGGYGGYQYSIKGGPPPPRPLRDLCVASFLPLPPPPLHSRAHTQDCTSALPECLRHHQLTHPRAILAKYRRLSNLLPANRHSPNRHSNKNNDNASCSRPAPTRDTTPATPSPAAQRRPSTPSPRRCTPPPPLLPSATAPTSRATNPTALTTFLPRAHPNCYLPEMCTSSPSPSAQSEHFKRRYWPCGTIHELSCLHVMFPFLEAAAAKQVTCWGGLRLVLVSRGPPPGPWPPPTVLHLPPRVPRALRLI